VPVLGETMALLRGWTVEECRERLAENTVAAFGHEVQPVRTNGQ
jgi:hypothetical protein